MPLTSNLLWNATPRMANSQHHHNTLAKHSQNTKVGSSAVNNIKYIIRYTVKCVATQNTILGSFINYVMLI